MNIFYIFLIIFFASISSQKLLSESVFDSNFIDINIESLNANETKLNSIKSRTAGKFKSLKRDIINLDPSQKELFDNIAKYEQSFERDIFQMLQLCEQKRLNRINLPELEKRLSEYENNVDDKINKTIAAIQTTISNLLYK